MTIREAIKHLAESYQPDEPCCLILWTSEDVRGVADSMGKKITDEQVADVLEHIEHHHDASLGVTWLTLEMAVDDIVKDEDETKSQSKTGSEEKDQGTAAGEAGG